MVKTRRAPERCERILSIRDRSRRSRKSIRSAPSSPAKSRATNSITGACDAIPSTRLAQSDAARARDTDSLPLPTAPGVPHHHPKNRKEKKKQGCKVKPCHSCWRGLRIICRESPRERFRGTRIDPDPQTAKRDVFPQFYFGRRGK